MYSYAAGELKSALSPPQYTDMSESAIGTRIPATNRAILIGVCLSLCISSVTDGRAPSISPANSATTANSIISSSIFTPKKPSTNPTTAPAIIGSRKSAQLLNCLKRLPSAYSNFSYSFKIIATAEPLTPGIIIARPMNAPKTPPFAASRAFTYLSPPPGVSFWRVSSGCLTFLFRLPSPAAKLSLPSLLSLINLLPAGRCSL